MFEAAFRCAPPKMEEVMHHMRTHTTMRHVPGGGWAPHTVVRWHSSSSSSRLAGRQSTAGHRTDVRSDEQSGGWAAFTVFAGMACWGYDALAEAAARHQRSVLSFVWESVQGWMS